jgi:ribosomal protein S2
VAYVFDSAGGLIANEEKIVDPKVKVLKGVFPSDGIYKVVVVADNTNKGKKIGEAIGYLAGLPVFAIAETIHPTGLVQVSWHKQK